MLFHKVFLRALTLVCALSLVVLWCEGLFAVDYNVTNVIGGAKGAGGKPGEKSDVGNIQNDINLFTGDVNFTHDLITLPGVGGLDISLGLTYNSNIQNLLYTNNKEAQGSWVGLGWTFTFGYIRADLKGTRAIYDDEYVLVTEDGSSHKLIEKEDNSFVLEDYRFWKIQRTLLDTTIVDTNTVGYVVGWKITKEDGTIFYYGDFKYGYGPLKANRCRLAWEDWVGDGFVDTLQNLLCYQWDLSKVKNATQEDSIVFEYSQEQEYLARIDTTTSDTIWISANPYTKASYLYKIYDSRGQNISFNLEDREGWEIEDPYTYYPEPDGFQELYETKRLGGVSTPSEGFEFVYDSVGVGPEGKKKVLLKEIVKKYGTKSLPSTKFEYYTDPADTNYGALKKITYPTGGSVEYSYGIKGAEYSQLDTAFDYQGYGYNVVASHPTISANSKLNFPESGVGKNQYWGHNWAGRWQENYSEYGHLVEGLSYNFILCSGDRFYAYYDVGATFPTVAWRWDGSHWIADTLAGIPPWYYLYSRAYASDDFFLVRNYGNSNVYCAYWQKDHWQIDTLSNFYDNTSAGKDMVASQRDFGNGTIAKWNGSDWITSTYGNMMHGLWLGNEYFVGSGYEDDDKFIQIGKWTGNDFRVQKSRPGDYTNTIWPGLDYFVSRTDDSKLRAYRFNGDGWSAQVLVGGSQRISTNDKDAFVKTRLYVVPLDTIHEFHWVMCWERWDGMNWKKYDLSDVVTSKQPIVRAAKDVAYAFYEGDGSLWAYRWVGGDTIGYRLTNWGAGVDTIQLAGGDEYCALLDIRANDLWVFRWNETKWDTTVFYHDTVTNLTYRSYLIDHADWFLLSDPTDDTIFFYKWSENQCTGHMKDHPIMAKKISDGFGNSSTWVIDYKNGIYDETNNFARYNKVTVTSPGENGYIVYRYYNDLDTSDGTQFEDLDDETLGNGRMLDGLPYYVGYYDEDSVLVAEDSSFWYAKDMGYNAYSIQLRKKVGIVDGITNTTEYAYSDTNGLPALITEHGSKGTTKTTAIDYAYSHFYCYPDTNFQEPNSSMLRQHMLSQVYKKTVKENGVPKYSLRTDWSNYPGRGGDLVVCSGWPDWHPERTYLWKDSDSDGTIDSNEYVLTRDVSGAFPYDKYGNLVCWRDPEGTSHVLKYVYNGAVPIAEVIDAYSFEVGVNDFEQGSSFDNWSLGSGSIQYYGHTGQYDCRLVSSADTAFGPARSFPRLAPHVPGIVAGQFTFSAWVKAKKSGVAGIRIREGTQTTAVVNTKVNQWQHIEVSFNYTATQSDLDFETFAVGQSDTVYFDDLRCRPKDALMTTKTYDPVSLNLTSESDENGLPVNYVYDTFGRMYKSLNCHKEAISSQFYWYSRELNNDQFSPNNPNCNSQRSYPHGNVVSGGEFENMDYTGEQYNWGPARGSEWGHLFEPPRPTFSDLLSSYASYDGEFGVALGGESGEYDSIGVCSGYASIEVMPDSQYVVGCDAMSAWDESDTLRILLRFYDKSRNSIDANLGIAGWTYSSYYNAHYKNVQVNTDYKFHSVALTIPDTAYYARISLQPIQLGVSIYVDNVIFSRTSDLSSKSTVANSYSDGLGRTVQSQIENGTTDVVSATTYDALGREHKRYKPYEASTGHRYDANWLTNVNAYYDSSGPGPDCGGYPYREKIHMNDPLGRVSIMGNPGTDFNKDSSHAIAITYRSNTISDSITGYDAGELSVVTVKDENGIKTQSFTDKFGNKVAVKSDSGGSQQYITRNDYDILGNLIRVIPPIASQDTASPYNSTYQYNTLGQLIRKFTPDDSITQYVYDKNSNLKYSQDEQQHKNNHFTVRYYDVLGRLVLVGVEKNQTYDWSTTYPSIDDTTFGKGADEWKTKYYYDQDYIAEGENYCRGRLTKEENNFDNGSTPENYTLYKYDKFGNIVEKRVWTSGLSERIIKYECDAIGRLTKLIYPDSSAVTYTYDDAGRLYKVGDGVTDDKYATYTYLANGLRRSVILGDTAQVVDYKYNPRDWMTSINGDSVVSVDTGNGDHFGLNLTYTSGGYLNSSYYNGNIASMSWTQSNSGSLENKEYKYRYDHVNRLTIASHTDSTHTEMYGYDPNSNLTELGRGGLLHDYDYYNNTNRVKQVSGWPGQKVINYLYDGNGNMTQDSSKSLLVYYDHRNLPTIAYLRKMLLGKTVSDVLYFYYDSKGQRIKKTHQLKYVCECGGIPGGEDMQGAGGLQAQAEALALGEDGSMSAEGGPPIERCICTKTTYTYYVYSGDNIIAEYGEGDTLQNNYVYGGNGRVAVIRKGTQNNKLLFPITDHLGSTRMVVDSTGTVQAKYTYYPFGDNLSSWISQGTDYKFTGKELDEESNFNLYYFGARYYDPKIARWISVDPINLGLSPYTYCYNNPLSYIDREGEFAWFLWPLIGAALGTSYAWAADVPGSDVWKYTLGGAFLTSGIGAGASLLPASKVAGFAVMGATLGTTGAWASGVPGGEVWKYAFLGGTVGATFGYACSMGPALFKGGMTLKQSASLFAGLGASGGAFKGIKEHSNFGEFWGDYLAGGAIGGAYGGVGYGFTRLPATAKWCIRFDYTYNLMLKGRTREWHHGYIGMISSFLGYALPGSDLFAVTGGILEADDYFQHVILQTYLYPSAAGMVGPQVDNIYPSPIHSGVMWLDVWY